MSFMQNEGDVYEQQEEKKESVSSNQMDIESPLEHGYNEGGDSFTIEDKFKNYQQMRKDLQFISMLANPNYVLALFDRGYFSNQQFIQYIDGLNVFFTKKKLFKLVRFPEGLFNLKIILEKGFPVSMRDPIKRDKFILNCLRRNQIIRKETKQIFFTRFLSLEEEERRANQEKISQQLNSAKEQKSLTSSKLSSTKESSLRQ